MQRVFVSYRLREGVPAEEFARFSRELDQVITASQPGVLRFQVHMVSSGRDNEGLDAPPAVDVVETLDVASWDAWDTVVASDAMAPVRDAFELVVDTTTVRMWRASAI